MSEIVNQLLGDKLFQVIGSTPKSIAESLSKIDLRGKTNEGAQLFAISVFSAAVNKATLETFLADSRFSAIRPLISASMSIQGRANMTALTLLGHCLMTTPLARDVNFSSEFRKKMGQEHLWAGELSSGSLSDKQKEILKEKKRLTDETAAKALGSGFLKLTGLVKEAMNEVEADLFNTQIQAQSTVTQGGGSALGSSGFRSGESSQGRSRQESSFENIRVSSNIDAEIPEDVLNYRRNVLRQSDVDILDSYDRKGADRFISDTRQLIASDPSGNKTRAASKVGK